MDPFSALALVLSVIHANNVCPHVHTRSTTTLQGIPFSLVFDPFSALALALSVIHANNVTSDATSHWLLGVQLVAVYVIISFTYLYR